MTGAEGQSAEIIADWNFWANPVVQAAPSGLLPSGTYASTKSSMSVTMVGFNQAGDLVYEYGFFDNEQTIVWLGIKDDMVKESGSISLGRFPVGGPNLEVSGAFYMVAETYSNPHGTAVATNLGGLSITLTPTAVIPIPPALWLFGFGLLGLVGIARRKKAA